MGRSRAEFYNQSLDGIGRSQEVIWNKNFRDQSNIEEITLIASLSHKVCGPLFNVCFLKLFPLFAHPPGLHLQGPTVRLSPPGRPEGRPVVTCESPVASSRVVQLQAMSLQAVFPDACLMYARARPGHPRPLGSSCGSPVSSRAPLAFFFWGGEEVYFLFLFFISFRCTKHYD